MFNLHNNAYNIVKALRKRGVEADLILEGKAFGYSFPMWEELELDIDPYRFNIREILKKRKYEFPEWIRMWWDDSQIDPVNVFSLFQMVKGYDLLHLHPPAPIYLQFALKPFVIHEVWWIRRLVTLNDSKGKLGRRAYAKADCIIMTNPDTYELLKLLKYKREVFIPFVIDTERYKPLKIEKSDELLFFHPTRHCWEEKGNDKLIHAFKRFIEEGYKARLRLVDWGWMENVEGSRKLIKTFGLERYVEWVPPYSKPGLIRAYNEADIVFDQFILGSGGTTLFEAMACEAPVVIYLNDWNVRCFGEMPPIANAKTPEEIYDAMVLLTDASERRKMGERERQFVLRHNHPDVVADKLVKLYMEILE
jgi:glycosyltransferase involved in cell wall biosynthesis